MLSAITTEKKLAVPGEKEWTEVKIPEIDGKLYDGAHISIPAHTIYIATHYPTFGDGTLVAGKTQKQVAEFLRDYNKAHVTNFTLLPLYADEAMRDQLGKEHAIFDENFERNGMPWRWGYIADFTKPYGDEVVEGVDGQRLVTRLIGYRLLGGDVELGVTTIAPTGMVPSLTREQLEKMIKKDGLKKLEQLRGREIYEKSDKIVDVRNALGYPQLTLGRDEWNAGGKLVMHSHHVYTPGQNDGETVGVRDAGLCRHGGRGCFDVDLDFAAGNSHSCRSFPLVRGGGVEAEVVRQNTKFRI